MALSYEFSIGSVRAKETSLFTNADIDRLLACKDEEELARLRQCLADNNNNATDNGGFGVVNVNQRIHIYYG